MGKPQAPTPPNPKQTSAAQTGTNVSTTIANNVMGQVDQTTPYGSLTYEQTGDYTWTDPYTNKSYTVPKTAANISLTPEGQALQSSNMATQQNLADTAVDRSAFLKDYLDQGPIDPTALDDKLYDLGTKRIDPRFEQQREATRTRLANQGIAPGSEAYNRKMTALSQAENDAYNQLALTGRSNALQELTTLRNQPINEIIGLLSGTQVQNPGVSMATMSPMPYTDNAGLINANYDQKFNNYQSDLASWNNTLGGILGLGANLIASDRRLKKNIEQVGRVESLPVYEFHYVWDDDDAPKQRGYMADEVQRVKPEAVVDIDGYMAVDYSMLPEVR